MKIRIIQHYMYTVLHTVQVKKWWYFAWVNVCDGDLDQCEQVFTNLVETGKTYKVVREA